MRTQNKKQQAASRRNWRLASLKAALFFLRRIGVYESFILPVERQATELIEERWEKEKKKIQEDPNYNVPY